jgi:hypothetical protein
MSSRSSNGDPPINPLAAGARAGSGDWPGGIRLGTAVLFGAVIFLAVVFLAVVFRVPPFRAPEARLRAVPPLLREPVIVRLRLPAALRFRLAPARALLRRLAGAARLVFFLPRGGILLLRELGSQSAAGEANPLPAFVYETGR